MGLFSILAILVGTAAAPRRLSLALAIRNDNYGGGLIHRATLALEAQLEVADEVVVLDFNTVWPRRPLVTLLPERVRLHPKLKSVVVDGKMCRELRRGVACGDRYIEPLARNAAVDAASGDVIASTNIDVVPPARGALDAMMDAVWGKDSPASGSPHGSGGTP